MNTVVTAQNLARHYEVGGGLFSKPSVVKALSEASFTIEAGKTLAVVGSPGAANPPSRGSSR